MITVTKKELFLLILNNMRGVKDGYKKTYHLGLIKSRGKELDNGYTSKMPIYGGITIISYVGGQSLVLTIF